MPGSVMYVVRSWPRLSQTFVINEVLALERLGVDLEIVSLVHSGEQLVQPQVADVRARVRFLDDARAAERVRDHLAVLGRHPVRYLTTMLFALRRPQLASGYATCTTRECFRHAVRVTAMVTRLRRAGRRPQHLHAHFAHDPALVGMLVHRLTGLPFSITAHARDLYQIPPASLAARAAAATTLVTCCQANADYIDEVLPAAGRPPVRVIHHGVELSRFTPKAAAGETGALTMLSVGRMVDKKGFGDLLQSCARLVAAGRSFACRIHGDGPLHDELVAQSARLGLGEVVSFPGEVDRDEIVRAMTSSDVFVLTPFEGEDRDRDGIPNVLVEAMACGLPVVTTSAGGIAELVDHGRNGLMAEPRDVAAVTQHLDALLGDDALRRALGAEARRTVESGYDVDAAARALAEIFGHGSGQPGRHQPVGGGGRR